MKALLALLLMLVALPFAQAAELNGVKMRDDIQEGAKTLHLNGLGLRRATMFNIKVYVAGLYLESRTQDSSQIIASTGTKKIQIQLLREVDQGRISGAWKDLFERNCADRCAALKPQLLALQSYMTDLREGDELAFTFNPSGVIVRVKGKDLPTIGSPEFGRILLTGWLGPKPPNPELRQGLLGLGERKTSG